MIILLCLLCGEVRFEVRGPTDHEAMVRAAIDERWYLMRVHVGEEVVHVFQTKRHVMYVWRRRCVVAEGKVDDGQVAVWMLFGEGSPEVVIDVTLKEVHIPWEPKIPDL